MSSLPLYFDYAATTPVDERVIRAMVECLGYQACFGNPASNSHAYGRQARRAVERAREQVAALVGRRGQRRRASFRERQPHLRRRCACQAGFLTPPGCLTIRQ
ncbi:hypothetical protein Z046_00500 [Pseudomonas aeruginosa VRFPA09]|nr:hypothetical protein Z046_00500 [Pseudomonas aeruginosa VRFPA09]